MTDQKGSDMKEMYEEYNKAFEVMSKDAPEYLRDFNSFYTSAIKKGALSERIKELISIALAITSHCLPCIALHVHNAIELGATRQEILETSGVAVLMGGSPAFVHIKHVLDACEQFDAK